MTDFSLMLPTIVISFIILFVVVATFSQGKQKPSSRSRKTSYTANDESYLFYSDIYDSSSYHHSGSYDCCGGDFGGGCDGGSDCG